MRHALELARKGIGAVEPNPPVGAVVVDDGLRLLGEGYHQQCGGPHAEVHALRDAGEAARGAQLFVTLEPCNHHGQTPPCCDAILQADLSRVVVATIDPASHERVSGIARLEQSGIEVISGLLADEAQALIASFTKLVTTGRPFVHVKWAMSLDGKIATSRGDSKWISGEESRAHAHRLRGRMDAIIVGIGTALADDPELTARPPGPRAASRIVLDSQARLPLESKLVTTARETPVIVFSGPDASNDRIKHLESAGVEVVQTSVCEAKTLDWIAILDELGRRLMTNVLVEGGSGVLGSCLDARMADWAHIFVAPKILGGKESLSPVGGAGAFKIADALHVEPVDFLKLGIDLFIEGRIIPSTDRNVTDPQLKL